MSNSVKKAWWLMGGEALDPALVALNSYADSQGLTKSTGSNQSALNTLIKALKAYTTTNATSIWDELDVIQVYLNNGSSGYGLLNLKNPGTNTGTLINACTWTSGLGFTGSVSSSMGINTNYNPNSGVKFTQNSAFIGCLFAPVFGEITTNTSTYTAFGSNDGTRNLLYYYTSNVWQARLNGGADVSTTFTKFTPSFLAVKRDSTNLTYYQGSATATSSQASIAISNNPVGVLCRKTVASQDLFCPKTAQIFFAGSKFASEGIRTILEAYQTATYVPAITESYTYLADYNFNDNTKLWKDAGKTIHPVDGEVIRAVENSNGTWGDLTAASDATAPLYQTAIINALNVAEWDGTDDNFDIPAHTALTDFTMFLVVKNDDSAGGSHPIAGAAPTTYVAVTGSAYGPGDYSIIHCGGGSKFSQTIPLKDVSDGWNTMAFRLKGTRIDGWNGRYLKLTNTAAASVFDPNLMGTANASVGATWNMDGFIGRVIVVDGYMSDETIEGLLVTLNTAYAL